MDRCYRTGPGTGPSLPAGAETEEQGKQNRKRFTSQGSVVIWP